MRASHSFAGFDVTSRISRDTKGLHLVQPFWMHGIWTIRCADDKG